MANVLRLDPCIGSFVCCFLDFKKKQRNPANIKYLVDFASVENKLNFNSCKLINILVITPLLLPLLALTQRHNILLISLKVTPVVFQFYISGQCELSHAFEFNAITFIFPLIWNLMQCLSPKHFVLLVVISAHFRMLVELGAHFTQTD